MVQVMVRGIGEMIAAGGSTRIDAREEIVAILIIGVPIVEAGGTVILTVGSVLENQVLMPMMGTPEAVWGVVLLVEIRAKTKIIPTISLEVIGLVVMRTQAE